MPKPPHWYYIVLIYTKLQTLKKTAQNSTIFPAMANIERNSRKRTLNPKLSSADNINQEAANLKRQKLQKGAITATTSKRHQASVKDSDEEEDNIPKQSCVGQPKNISPEDSSDDSNGDV